MKFVTFFENIIDCENYYKKLDGNYSCYIIKVEILDSIYIDKFDNNWISNFDSNYTTKEYKIAVENFLLRKQSDSPIFEVLFIGKYKIKECRKFELH